MIHPVILCGGSGTRLWPVSRRSWPKQFAPLLGAESLFQATLRRLSGPDFAPPLVLAGDAFRFIVTGQAEAAGIAARLLVEPVARNTAPAVLAAALALEADPAAGPEALMLVAPSDHAIADAAAFRDAVRAGAGAARAGRLVTFGIRPDRPETGYGWLELAGPAGEGPQPLLRFVEKPDAARAAAMLASGRFLWNAGIFLFRVADILAAFAAHAPDFLAPCRAALAAGRADLGFFRLGAAEFAAAPERSLDYAVMERAANLSVVPFAGGWSDLGAWDAVWRALGPDAAGVASAGPVTALGCRDSLLRSEEPGLRLVGIGLEGIAAVAMRDAVLVAPLARAQEVKEAVAALKAAGAAQAEDFPRVHRPWGWHEDLAAGPRFRVRRIMVVPGGRLALQSHMHRSEHWIVVSGTARVTVGGSARLLAENESVHIPLGAVHRLENPGRVEMQLIEVQSGAYLGEDDVVRHDGG